MATNRPDDVNLGEIGVCLIRMAILDTDCSPLGGNNSGYITAGIADMTASPDVQEGTRFEPTNGCGITLYRVIRRNRVRGFNMQGNLWFFDDEGLRVMFGGTNIVAKAGHPFAGKTIGWALPNYDSEEDPKVYLEVITQTVEEGAGECIASGTGHPAWTGHIFGNCRLTMGELSFGDEAMQMPFTAAVQGNPSLFNGPWNDYPGVGYIPNSPYVRVGYTQAEYDAILAAVGPGYADLPAGS